MAGQSHREAGEQRVEYQGGRGNRSYNTKEGSSGPERTRCGLEDTRNLSKSDADGRLSLLKFIIAAEPQ